MDPEKHHLYPFHLHPPPPSSSLSYHHASHNPPYPSPPYQYHPSPTVSYPPPSFNVTPMPHQTHPNEDYFRNEVIFLHSLWHQGPPNYNPNPNPISNFHHHLKPTHSTPFKKKSKPPISDHPWTVPPDPSPPPLSDSGWPEFPSIPFSLPSTQALTNGGMAKVSAIRVQKWGIDCFKSFFAGKRGSESESESESDDDDIDQDRVFSDGFLEVFDGNEELKGYYLNNWGNGDFMCLVCGGSGQKVGRKFKDCVALIQHTITISQTKKRAAHRAYGLVVCKVLGWDIQQLPLVSRNLSLQQGNHISSAEACKDDPVRVETYIASFANENVQSDPSTTTSNVGNDNSAEEKKTAGLPSVLDNPGEGNHIRSAEACKDESLGVETHIVPFVNENIQSVPSTATSDVGIDNADEEKETAGLPSVLDSPGEGNEMSSEACKPVGVEANFVSLVDQIEHSGPSKVTSDTGKNNSPEKKETSDLPLFMITPNVQQINDTSNADTDTNHSDTVAVLNEHGLSSPKAGDDNEPEMKETSSVHGQAT